jgi:oligosaccharyltransferase complex subunit alpha (ribophorin I)
LYCYLPYPAVTQTTTVNLASSNVESHTKTKPVALSGDTITYGPHKNVAAFSASELVVHSENNSPMLVVSNLHRLIEVASIPQYCL